MQTYFYFVTKFSDEGSNLQVALEVRLDIFWEKRYHFRKNNGRKDFSKIWKDKEIKYNINEIINRCFFWRNGEIKIENGMMEWRHKRDQMKDYGRMVKYLEDFFLKRDFLKK